MATNMWEGVKNTFTRERLCRSGCGLKSIIRKGPITTQPQHAKILDYIFQVAIMTGLYYGAYQLAIMENNNGVSRKTIAIIGICLFVLWLLVPFLYNYLPLAGSGATMGKKMLGLVVVRQNRQPLGYGWALLRVLTEYVCVGACYGMAVAIFIGLVRLQMQGGGTGTQFTPPRMPPIHQPGTPFVPPRPPSPASAADAPLKLLLTMPVFLLTFVPYIPAFFTKGRRATHDLIVRTLVISR